MSFAAAVDRLHALGHELTARRKFDLEHMRVLARALGSPQLRFPAVLIAGTNGKGSTAATLASILAAAGLRTGLYTSPHLERVTERIRIAEPRKRDWHPERPRASGGGVEEPVLGPPNQSAATTDNWQLTTGNWFSEIAEADFARLYFRVDEVSRRLVAEGRLPHHPSYFETLTALAFLYFAGAQSDGGFGQPVDIAVLEVGMGGRLDATNIVEPILSVITDIALDHQEWLGHTIAEISREKAGILRPGGTLVTLPQHPEANQAIGEAAIALGVRAINAADYLPGRDALPAQPLRVEGAGVAAGFSPRSTSSADRGALAPEAVPATSVLRPNHYDLSIAGETLHVRSPLAGEHQRRNIALAIAAAMELRNHFSSNIGSNDPYRSISSYKLRFRRDENGSQQSFALNLAAIEAGIANTSWPGRLEFLPPNLLLDVAHNPAGAWALRAAIARLPEDQPRTLIFSCLRDKDVTEMAQILFPLFDAPPSPKICHPERAQRVEGPAVPSNSNLILTPIDSPRAAPVGELLAAAAKLDIPARAAASPADALAMARELTPPGGLIIATGSIYLVGAIREAALRP